MITFGDFHIKFASGAFTDLAVVYLGQLGQNAEDSVTDTLIAFGLENMETLENWNGDKSLLKNSDKHLGFIRKNRQEKKCTEIIRRKFKNTIKRR